MIKYTHRQISKYDKIFNSLRTLGIIVVVSDPETGKTFISEEFIKKLNCEKWMLDNINGENGLKKLYNQIFQKLEYSSSDKITFDFTMRKLVISYIIQPEPKVIILDNFESYNSEVLTFWEMVINSVKELINSKCLIIINTNSTDSLFGSNLLRVNSMYIHSCNLPVWKPEDLKELFYLYYKNEIKIKHEDLETIIEYSLYNPAQLLDNIYVLKDSASICYNYEDNLWVCNKIDERILAMRYSDKIKLRYNKLDNNLKIAINKASLIGINFDCLTLTNIFEIRNAKNIFKRIEEISKLIRIESITPDEYYRFISERVRNEIETYIIKEDLFEWRKLLGHYYFLTINESKLLKTQKAINMERAAKYFYDSNEYDKSMRCKNELIKILVDINCYSEAVLQIESLIDLIKNKNINEHLLSFYFYYLTIYNLKLFKFEQSFDYFKLYKKTYKASEKQNYYENIYIDAFCHYNMNDTKYAYKILNEAYKDIMEKEKNNIIIDWNNACKILEVFISVCDSLDNKKSIKIYNTALHLSKKYGLEERYYTLLRKANIAHENEPSIKLMSEAKRYFFERDVNEYAMAMHNIAMEYVYIPGEINNVLDEIKKSKRIFDEIGSISSKLTGNVFGIYYCFTGDYNHALKEFEKIEHGDSFCNLAALINRINCFRKLKNFEAEMKAITEAETLNSKEFNNFNYFKNALLVLNAYALMERNDETNDKAAIKLFDQYLMIENSCDRVEQKLSVKLTVQTLKNKYNITIPKNQRINKGINPVVKYLSDERLYFCEILFIE